MKYTINANEIIDEELLQLKKEKNDLLQQKDKYNNQLLRIEKNLESKNTISPTHLKKLKTFFPNANIEKISNIESFHKKVSNILKSEIKSNKENISTSLNYINVEIKEIDEKIHLLLSKNDSPKIIVDKIHDLTIKRKDFDIENSFYEEKESIVQSLKENKSNLKDEVLKIVENLNKIINKEIELVNQSLHNDKRTSPLLTLQDNIYSYKTINNTGTGKAYINLLIFDLSIFRLTKLPILMHDSFLFKNIEDATIEKLIEIYSNFDRQVFIAIDKIDTLNKRTKEIIEKKHIAKLNNENMLFRTDWR